MLMVKLFEPYFFNGGIIGFFCPRYNFIELSFVDILLSFVDIFGFIFVADASIARRNASGVDGQQPFESA